MNATEPSRTTGPSPLLVVLRVVAAAGLAIDARVHLRLASTYDAIRSSAVSQGDLFRIEAALAVLAAVAVLVLRRPVAALVAALVAGGGLVPLLVYRYVDLGTVGPFPPMYEPVWYSDKTMTAVAQAVAAAAALALLLIAILHRRRARLVPAP